MLQDLDHTRAAKDVDSIPEEIQQIWLSNELMKRVKKVAHDIDERVSHVLQNSGSPDRA
jgi:hypothetical protein